MSFLLKSIFTTSALNAISFKKVPTLTNENLFQTRNKMILLWTILISSAKSRINWKQNRVWVMMMRESEGFENLGCVRFQIPDLRMRTEINKNKIMKILKYALTDHYSPTTHQQSIYWILISLHGYARLLVGPNYRYCSSVRLCIRRLLMNIRFVLRHGMMPHQWPEQRRLLRPKHSNQILKRIYWFLINSRLQTVGLIQGL